MNKKKITSVALAFTLAVAAPVKANLISLDFGPSHVIAASPQATSAYEQAKQTTADKKTEMEQKQTAYNEAKKEYDAAKKEYDEAVAAYKASHSGVTNQATIDADSSVQPKKAAMESKNTDMATKNNELEAAKTAYNQASSTEATKKAIVDKQNELEALITKANAEAAKTGTYTSDSIANLKSQITTAESKKASEDLGELNTQIAALQQKVNDLKQIVNQTVTLNRPTVYYNKVSGSTTPGATVTLYKNGSYQGSATADSYGNYTIYHNFGTYNNAYYNGYYGTASVRTYGSTYVDGYTSANIYVEAVNNGVVVGSGYSNSSGYYSINFNRTVSNPNATTVYTNRNGYYNGGYYYYNDLADYTLEATKTGMSPATYNLKNAYTDNYYNYNYGYRYQDPIYNYAYAATVTSATPGSSVVTGRGLNSYALVSVYDSNNVRLGSTTALSDGTFTVSLNRNLRAGETISVTSSYSNYRNNTVTYKVAGTEAKASTYNYTVTMTIGDKNLTIVKDGITTNTTMDTEAYIKDGRTMLPIRYVAQALGYNVTWNDATRTASFSDGKRIVILNVDSSEFYVDGVKNTFSVAPEIKDGRTMLPVSDIGKALGMTTGNKGDNKNIEWDSVLRQVKIQLTK